MGKLLPEEIYVIFDGMLAGKKSVIFFTYNERAAKTYCINQRFCYKKIKLLGDEKPTEWQ